MTSARQMHWMSHAQSLEILKTHVNQLGQTLTSLEQLKPQANEGQRMAIENARPHLVGVAQQLTRAIDLLSDDRQSVILVALHEYGDQSLQPRRLTLRNRGHDHGLRKVEDAPFGPRPSDLVRRQLMPQPHNPWDPGFSTRVPLSQRKANCGGNNGTSRAGQDSDCGQR